MKWSAASKPASPVKERDFALSAFLTKKACMTLRHQVVKKSHEEKKIVMSRKTENGYNN